MMVSHASDILVERAGAEQPCTLWLWLRGQDLDPASEQDLHMLVDATRDQCPRFSVLLKRLGSRFELRQDITSALHAHADAVPPVLPVLPEHLANGDVFVWIDHFRRIPAAQAAALFKEALRWCAHDYSDLMGEFQEQLESWTPA
jgi:hypothetical protein